MSNRSAQPWRVLLVDDNPLDRAAAKAALLNGSNQRYSFTEAETATQAILLCAASGAFDVCVLDFELSDGTALDVLATLPRDADSLPLLPVVILTGTVGVGTNQSLLRAGAQDYVGKAWLGPESLTRAVENAIERHAMSRDLSKSQSLLAAREYELRTLTDNSPDILTRFDRQLRHVFVNAAITRATGLRPDQIIGKTNRELGMDPGLCDLWDAALRQVLDVGEPQYVEFPFEGPDGLREYGCRLIAEVNPDGVIEYVLGVAHDITDRRRNEATREELLTAERAARSESERVALIKDQFLATLSHELRTPLAAIVGWSNILKRSTSDASVLQRGIDAISRNSKVQARLIDDLLDMNRIVSGKLKIEREIVEIDLLAMAAIDTLRPAADSKGVALRLDIAHGRSLQVRGDATRLQQVLANLLHNALKFTPPKGTVSLKVGFDAANAVQLVVRDTGQGIDPNYLPHLFGRFSQADSSAARVHGGLGLGLSIVRELVELHDGTVSAASDGLGQGAAFVVTLPGVRHQAGTDIIPDSNSGALDSEPARLTDLTGLTVLIVDDQEDVLELTRQLLTESGAHVVTSVSARGALVAIRERCPDVLLSDVGMPEMDGFQLIEEVRQQLGLSSAVLPAIALSAFNRSQDRERALQSGYQEFIVKPARSSLLIRTVSKWTNQRESD